MQAACKSVRKPVLAMRIVWLLRLRVVRDQGIATSKARRMGLLITTTSTVCPYSTPPLTNKDNGTGSPYDKQF